METARGEHRDGVVDLDVSHQRRVEELNHAIDSPRKGRRECRRRLRQPLRLRRKRRRFFIEFVLQICRGWLSPGGSCNLSDSLLEEAESVAGASLRVANLRDANELRGGFFVADFHQLEGASDYDQEFVEVFKV